VDPNEIQRLIAHGKRLAENPSTSPEAFLILYVAWEAFVRRLLRIALAAQGFDRTQSDIELRDAKLSSKDGLKLEFRKLYGREMAQTPGVGHMFRDLSKINVLRHKFAHGRSRTKPETYLWASGVLISLIDAEWELILGRLLADRNIVTSSTNPMGRIVAKTTKNTIYRPSE
jgi:hypothetical protein